MLRGNKFVGFLVALAMVQYFGAAQQLPPRAETAVIGHGVPTPPTNFNPLAVPGVAAWGSYLMYPTLFRGHAAYGPDREEVMIPYLAKGFRWIDSQTLEIYLRPEARWWDGTPITAHDVKYSYELGRRHTTYWNSACWAFLEEIRVLDDYTLQFIASAERLNYFEMLNMIAGDAAVILPRHVWEPLEQRYGPLLVKDFKNNEPEQIVGGGPYRLIRWDLDYVLMERLDDWWGKDIFGLPRPRYLLNPIFRDAAARNLAFEQLAVDVIDSAIDIWELQARGLPVGSYYNEPPYFLPSFGWGLFINFARPPLDNPVIRRAIAYAVPAEEIGLSLPAPHAVAHPTMIVHTFAAAAALIDEEVVARYGWVYDPKTAEKLLDEAGIVDRDGDGVRETPDGVRLGPWEVTCWVGFIDGMIVADMIAASLRKIGIDAIARYYDFAIWDGMVIRGEFDMAFRWIFGWRPGYPWNVFRTKLDPRVTGPVGEPFPAGNWHRYMNQDVVPFIDAIPRETDPEKVKYYYSRLQEYQLRDVVVVPLFYGMTGHAYSEACWVGWPTAERPNGWIGALTIGGLHTSWPQFFGLVPVREDILTSPLDTHMAPLVLRVSAFWEELARVR